MAPTSASRGFTLRGRFMAIVALGIIALAASTIGVIYWMQKADMEERFRGISRSELSSLHALIVNVMAKRPEDPENIGVTVFNNWFASRNTDYPGELWSVWGPKVAQYMQQTEPDRAAKPVRDETDRAALASGQPVGRFVGDTYRYSFPIVLGVTEGANQEVCFSCHGGMEMEKGEVIAVLSSSLSTQEAEGALARTLALLTACGLAAAVVGVLVIRWVLGRVITDPLAHMTGLMGRLAGGDHSIAVPETIRRDEIGAIARAIEVFKENASAKARMEAEQAREAQARDERMKRLEAMIAAFDRAVEQVLGAVAASTRVMGGTAERLAGFAHEASKRSLTVEQAARDASANVQTVAAAAEELSSSIREIAAQVENSSRIASTATHEAHQADGRVQGLTSAAERIGQIVTTITDIAEQTNLLALNATVEAARAGEAGKGFQVVATEVKNLARQTVHATEGIAGQVGAIQDETRNTVEAIRDIGKTIGDIDGISTQIASAVEEQGAATQEIARSIDEAARGTAQVSSNLSEVNRTIAETDRAAQDVLSAVQDLTRQAETLRGEVDRFLSGIRSV